jgi:hypothetical protein
VGTQRTAWHFFFAILLRKCGPSWIEVRDEVPLADERPRLDYLLLRKTSAAPADDSGRTLRRLWQYLGLLTIVELKSIGRPYRSGNLDRLWGYVHAYYADESVRPPCRADLRAVLVVPARSPALTADVDAMGLGWKDLGVGYWQLERGLFPLYVVEIDVVAEQEDDDLLRLFSHDKERTREAQQFWAEQVGTKEAGMAVQELEGYDEVMQKLLDSLPPEQRLAGLTPEQRLAGLAPEQRLAGLAPEQRLAGLDPEQRLAGLDPEQAILALPDEVLRGFSEKYLRTLSEATRAAIQKRLGRSF